MLAEVAGPACEKSGAPGATDWHLLPAAEHKVASASGVSRATSFPSSGWVAVGYRGTRLRDGQRCIGRRTAISDSGPIFPTMPDTQDNNHVFEQEVTSYVVTGHPVSHLFRCPLVGRLSDSSTELRMLSETRDSLPK